MYSPELPVTLQADPLFGDEKQLLLDARFPGTVDSIPQINLINEDSDLILEVFLDIPQGELRMANPNMVG